MSQMTGGVSDTSAELTPRSLKIRLYVMMFLQYFVQGCYLPIISLYLQDALGFGSVQIGVFSAAISVGPLVAPFLIGQIVDRYFATEHVLAFCHLVSGATMVAIYYQSAFWPVIILGTAYSVLYMPSMMLTNSLAFYHLKNSSREFPLIRMWGTIGFVVPAWLVEMVLLRGLTGPELTDRRGIVLWLSGAGGLLMGLYSLTLPHTPPSKAESGRFAPGAVLRLLGLRYFLTLVTVSFVIAVVHQHYFTWNSPFLKTMLDLGGVTGAWEQRISSIGQIAEILVMALLAFALRHLGFKRLMMIGLLAYMLRCLLFAGSVVLELPFPVTMAVICVGQAMHGFCFGCFWAVAYMYLDRTSPPDIRGSMQNLYGTSVLGGGLFVGGFLSGIVTHLFTTGSGVDMTRDWPGIWLVGAATAAVCVMAFGLLFPREPESLRKET